MNKYYLLFSFLLIFPLTANSQNTAPEVTNVTFEQRADGSFKVDVYCDLYDADGDDMTV